MSNEEQNKLKAFEAKEAKDKAYRTKRNKRVVAQNKFIKAWAMEHGLTTEEITSNTPEELL